MSYEDIEAFRERLKEWLHEKMDDEKENMNEARRLAGNNSVGFGMALGAHDAFQETIVYLFGDIEQPEQSQSEGQNNE